MEINHVSYRGKQYPLVSTPISNVEMGELREKYKTFLIKDVRSNTVKLVTNSVEIQRFHIDFGFRPMVYCTALVLAFYNYIQVKKKIKKATSLKWGGNIKDFIKMEVTPPNGTKAVEL